MDTVVRYRIEFWNGGAWQPVSWEYEAESDAEKRLRELITGEFETAYRLVQCTYKVISMRAFLTEVPHDPQTT